MICFDCLNSTSGICGRHCVEEEYVTFTTTVTNMTDQDNNFRFTKTDADTLKDIAKEMREVGHQNYLKQRDEAKKLSKGR